MLKYEVVEDRNYRGCWLVEAINYEGDGEIYSASFSGPNAESLAVEYAAWKNNSRALGGD
jgi:hypothetical protein